MINSVKKLVLFAVLAVGFYTTVSAKIGVGVGTGLIAIKSELKPGGIYELPSINIVNTGDVESEYELNIAYHEKQPELRPSVEWFEFSPKNFHLNPHSVQVVDIKINLPIKTEPGTYFAYIEAYPLKKAVSGETNIGIAAATKIYFNVIPATTFDSYKFKLLSLWRVYWVFFVSLFLTILIMLAYFIFKKVFKVDISLNKSKK